MRVENRGSLISTVVLLAFLAHPAQATVYRLLTGDYTTINADWSAYENGQTFTTVESGTPSAPVISTQHYAGNASLTIQVPTDNTGNKERFEYTLAHASDPDGLHFDNARYSGFAFRLASPAASFGSSMLFWQAWQGSPWGPPASLKLTADTSAPYTIGLYIRNMTNGPDSAVSDTKLWSSQMIQPDTWYAVVIYLAPRYTNGNGQIKLWINGTQYADWTGNIGYDPAAVTGAYAGLDLKNGIYQPDANNGHTMFFDQLIVADSFAEAAALPPPVNHPPIAGAGRAAALKNSFVDCDLASLVSDAETAPSQCVYSLLSASNGTASLLPDGHTARFIPAANWVGPASFAYAVIDNGEDPRLFFHYSFEPPDAAGEGYATDNSGHLRDATLAAVGSGTFAYSGNTPFPLYSAAALSLSPGPNGGARLVRFISSPAELNLSDSDWTFACWFERAATTNHDFLVYLGGDNGFGGGGDELQLYCPNGSSTLALQHYDTNNTLDVSVASGGSAGIGQWHHAALVFQRTNTDAGLLRVYLDGTQVAATNVVWHLQQQQAPLIFGGHNSTSSSVDRWFNGALDDLALFTNALAASDIARLARGTVAHFGGLSATNSVSVIVTNYPRPWLSGVALANGVWSMTVNGSAGPDYIIQTATNLVNPAWTSLATNVAAQPPFVFRDSSAAALQRFYRVLLGP